MSNSLHSTAHGGLLTAPMLFTALEAEVQDRLRAASPPRRFGDGQFIQHRGTRADGFWLIEEGAVRIGIYLPDGEFRAIAVLGPGDSYGELAVFAGTPRIVDAVSRGESHVRFIAARAFLDAVEASPASGRALLAALSAQLQDALDQLAGMRRGTNPTRLAGLLSNLARGGDTVAITQQELAELLGVTRATANAALRELEKAGLIRRGYGRLAIPDAQALTMFALT